MLIYFGSILVMNSNEHKSCRASCHQHLSTPKGHMVHLEKLHNSTPGCRGTRSRLLECVNNTTTPYTPKSERFVNGNPIPFNPFDHNLVERLHAPMFSPNVFACVNDSDTEV